MTAQKVESCVDRASRSGALEQDGERSREVSSLYSTGDISFFETGIGVPPL
jgi:hypothetical protein